MPTEQPSGDAALIAAAADLIALPLGDFTAERNTRAKAVRGDGHRDLAARISALPKPSVAAWVVDLLARETPDDLQRVLDLGADLRQAQDDGDRDRLRELTIQRRSLLGEVARATAARAEQAGQRVGDAALEEVQQTLRAALASPEAAAAIRTGRLVRSLDADGLDPVDLADAVAGGAPEADAPPAARRTRPATAEDDRVARQRAEDRRKRLAAAKDRADRTAADLRDAEATAADRKTDAADLRRQLDDLQARLERAEQAVEDAESAASKARDESEEAAAEVERIGSGD